MNYTANRVPALFLGHGSPMNVLQPDLHFNQAIGAIGRELPRPKAIVMVSAHWYDGLQITGIHNPEIIYDFYGFPDELYRVEYPVAGSPELAQTLQQLLPQARIHPTRGLDHGTWAVLKFLYPNADVPVVQLGLDLTQPPAWHYQCAGSLRALREQGVLIIGSGNIVHNLRTMVRHEANVAYDWAADFRAYINQAMVDGNHQAIVDYLDFGDAARWSVPSPEHFLPLLYVLAQQDEHSQVRLFNDEIVMGSLSMTSVMVS